MSTGKEVVSTGGLSVRAMWTLWAIDDGLEFVAEPDGTMVVVLPRQVAWEVGDEVDELIARGWIRPPEVGVRVKLKYAGAKALGEWLARRRPDKRAAENLFGQRIEFAGR